MNDEVDDFRQATEAYSGIGCAGCVIVMLLGIAVAIGFILLFIHILNHYRV